MFLGPAGRAARAYLVTSQPHSSSAGVLQMSSAKAASDLLSCAALNTVLFAAYDIVPRAVTDPSSEQLRRLLDYVQTLKSAANSTFKSGSYG